MSLIRWEPLREIESAFDDVLPVLGRPKMGWDTAVDVYEKDNSIIAEMNLPGMSPENIEVSLADSKLYVGGSREEAKEEKDKEYVSKEIVRGSFSRIIALPSTVDEASTEARYKDGVLTVVMPKVASEQQEKKKIPVQKA